MTPQSGGGSRKVGNPAAEYVADWELIARRALARWPHRLRLFELYFVGNMPYREAVSAMKVPQGTFNYWAWEIKKVVGRALAESSLWRSRCGRG